MSHTPGPWTWREHYQGLVAANGYQVLHHAPHEGMCVPDYDNGVADARLIAAAPELLAELKQLVRLLEPAESTGLNVPGLATLNAARAAIKAAEGK
jgi:hypothetical protein